MYRESLSFSLIHIHKALLFITSACSNWRVDCVLVITRVNYEQQKRDIN